MFSISNENKEKIIAMQKADIKAFATSTHHRSYNRSTIGVEINCEEYSPDTINITYEQYLKYIINKYIYWEYCKFEDDVLHSGEETQHMWFEFGMYDSKFELELENEFTNEWWKFLPLRIEAWLIKDLKEYLKELQESGITPSETEAGLSVIQNKIATLEREVAILEASL